MLTILACTLLLAALYPYARSLPAAAALSLVTVIVMLLLQPSFQSAPVLVHLAAVGVVFIGLRVIMPVLCGEWVKPGIVTGLRVGRLAFGVTLLQEGV